MAHYMLLLRDPGQFPTDISPEEIQAIIAKYQAWGDRVRTAGKLVAGQKLTDGQGRVLRPQGSKVVVTDGPFAETKEVMGGYYIVDAASYEDAVKLCDGHPQLEFGGSIEVREIENA